MLFICHPLLHVTGVHLVQCVAAVPWKHVWVANEAPVAVQLRVNGIGHFAFAGVSHLPAAGFQCWFTPAVHSRHSKAPLLQR